MKKISKKKKKVGHCDLTFRNKQYFIPTDL